MWTALTLALLAADPSFGLTVGGPSAPPTPPPPPPQTLTCLPRRAPVRACTVDADCVLFHRIGDCCGTRQILGVARDDLAAIQSEERQCGIRGRTCGCMEGPTRLDDGSRADHRTEARVACRANVCTTFGAPRETSACTPAECGPQPALPNWLCADGVHRGGLGPCQRVNGRCGWTRLTCPTP